MIDIIYLLGVTLGIFALSAVPVTIILKSFTSLEDNEIISSSFGLSFFTLACLSFVIYILKLSPHLFSSFFSIAILLIAFVLRYTKKIDISSLIKKNIFIFYTLYFAFILSCQFLYPVYCGGGWYGDWYEHYERAQFFLEKWKLDYKFLDGLYTLPARTPLFNLVGTFFLSLFGNSFSIYQITSTVLNTLFLLPLYLITKELKNKNIFYFIFALVVLNPFLFRMASFTFTKSLTCYYVLMGIYFYLKFEKLNSKKYLYLSSAFLSFAYLTHQYSVSYIFAVFIFIFFRRRNLFFKFLLPMVIISLPWHIFSFLNFGIKETIFATPSFSWEKANTFSFWLYQRFLNLQGAIFPALFIKHILRDGFQTFKDEILFLSSYQRLLNFYQGAIPAVLTLTGSVSLFFYIFKKNINIKNLFVFPNSFIMLIIICGFTFDILLVNNPGVPLGMAQNGMMPLCILLLLFLGTVISSFRKKYFALVFSGIYLEFALTTFLFFYFLNQGMLFDGNIDLVIKHNLLFLKEYLNVEWFFILAVVILQQIIILRFLYLKILNTVV